MVGGLVSGRWWLRAFRAQDAAHIFAVNMTTEIVFHSFDIHMYERLLTLCIGQHLLVYVL